MNHRLLAVMVVVGPVFAAPLAAPAEARTHPAQDAVTVARMQMPMAEEGEAGNMKMDGGEMEMAGAMMMVRPDIAPPLGVLDGMSPRQGKLMISLKYMHMRMEGNRDGTDDLSRQDVLAQFPVAPLNMNMNMVMGGAMYGITDDISVMAMVPYVWKDMDHRTRTGVEFTTKSEGFGDVKALAGYDVIKRDGHTVKLLGGLSFPTGSTDEKDDTPAGPDQPLPYPMQTGSGTFDLIPGLNYTGMSDKWSWGGQFFALVRLGENDDDYTLGNVYQTSVWGARRWTDWVSTSVRLIGEVEENIDGADPRLNPNMVPTADPDRRGGDRLEVGLGINFLVPSGFLQGLGFRVEGIIPVYQSLDGPQLERDYAILAGIRKMF